MRLESTIDSGGPEQGLRIGRIAKRERSSASGGLAPALLDRGIDAYGDRVVYRPLFDQIAAAPAGLDLSERAKRHAPEHSVRDDQKPLATRKLGASRGHEKTIQVGGGGFIERNRPPGGGFAGIRVGIAGDAFV